MDTATYTRDRLATLLRMNGVPQGDVLNAMLGITFAGRNFTITRRDALTVLRRLSVPANTLGGYGR